MGAFVMRLSVNEAPKSRMIKPRNWLNPVDEKKHRDEILDNMKKFLDNYFDGFEILVELDKLADGVDRDTQKLEELQTKFQEKEKEISDYIRSIERSVEKSAQRSRFVIASRMHPLQVLLIKSHADS